MLRKSIVLILSVFCGFTLSAQISSGTLKGKVIDKNSGEPLPFANVVLFQGSQQISGGTTNFDGEYTIKPINPGTYDVKCFFVGYKDRQITGVKINANKITFLDLDLSTGSVDLEEVVITGYKVPLIDKDGGASGGTVTREDIAKMPGRSALSVATTVGGVSQAGTGGGVSIRGSRTNNTVYFIDGIKVRGSLNLPKSAIEEVNVLTGGIPANVGDVTGGAINITTRSSSIPKFFGGVDLLSSGFRIGDDIIGLDSYGQTQIEGSVGGPLAFRKDSVGNKLDPFLGFFISGNFRKFEDTRPSAIGNWYLKEDVKADLQQNPISALTNTDGSQFVIYNTDFLRAENFENLDARRNSDLLGASLSTKFDFTPSTLINVSVGGSADYIDRQNYSRLGSVFNYQNNSNRKDLTWRVFTRFTQRFASDTEAESQTPSSIKNAFYTVSVDYSKFNRTTQHQIHEDNFFNYGYIGKYTTFQNPNYAFVDTLGGGNGLGLVQDGFLDTLITFEPGNINPDLAQVSSAYFNLLGPDGNYRNFEDIQGGGGLLNGNAAPNVYGLWINNAGVAVGGDVQNNTYTINDDSQFRVTANGSADVGDHAIQIGFEYEQRVDRDYGLAPRGLWGLARQLANFHIQEIDYSVAPDINYLGGFYFYNYPRLVGPDQSAFDRNLRDALGAPADEFIFVDELDPEFLDLSFFSADDLLNDGSNLVTYNGYDHLGNKITGNPSFDDFFTEVDENGDFTRPIGAFEPIYMAGYVMDKFAFDDIIFNVGLRVDRYDANQKVLKDDYVVGEFFTAGEVSDLGEHPSNIGDDFVVYVNDLENPTSINGYRDGDQWYNAVGTPIDNPSAIRTPNGIAPYLVNTDEIRTNLTSKAFKDYKPAITVMPRVSFSFPISDEATFFAHYDILSQRPTFGNRLDPIEYYYIATRSDEVNNPNLQPTKTIDYELGFQQVLSRTSSLKIAAFYREMRNMITSRFLAEAFPRQYITYRNIDFGTSKGLTLAYDLRRTGNIWMKLNYTLQFASGTGSNATSNLDLSRAGEPNLRTVIPLDFDQRHNFQLTFDYRYGSGKDYNGPVWFDKQVFANTGLNMVANLGSGTPYTSREGAVSLNGIGFAGLDGGTPNSARYPWQFNVNAVLDKDVTLTFGKDEGEKAKTSNLNIYLLVNNLFNTKNIIGVYSVTGSPDDDGYLVTGLAQQDIQGRIDPASYLDLYNLRLANPNNYSIARTIQLGLKLDF